LDRKFEAKMDAKTRKVKYGNWKKAVKRTMGWEK